MVKDLQISKRWQQIKITMGSGPKISGARDRDILSKVRAHLYQRKSLQLFVGNIVHKRVHTVKLAQKEQSPNALPTKFLAFRVELTADPIKRKEIFF